MFCNGRLLHSIPGIAERCNDLLTSDMQYLLFRERKLNRMPLFRSYIILGGSGILSIGTYHGYRMCQGRKIIMNMARNRCRVTTILQITSSCYKLTVPVPDYKSASKARRQTQAFLSSWIM